MNRILPFLLLAALSACGDAERGGFCFAGQCPLADGGTLQFSQVCNPYQCLLPDDAPAAGVKACQHYAGTSNDSCVGPATSCTAAFAYRPDWEDCYGKY